jgi:hypothetical protein
MKQFMFAAAVVAMVCTGCTIRKYKGVSVETDGSGKVIQRVESESASQHDWTIKRMELKMIQQ